MGVDTKYIYFNHGTGRYHVRMTRGKVTYNIGRFDSIPEAIIARDKFIERYNANPPLVVITQYSKEWFELQSKTQLKMFAERGKA